MSTITDAIKKRKKEAGPQETQELVPVSLDEPDVEIPKGNGSQRVVVAAVGLVLIAAAAGAVVLSTDILRGKSKADNEKRAAPVASLPKAGTGEVSSAEEPAEAPPLPEKTAEAVGTAAEAGPRAAEVAFPSPRMPVPGAPAPAVAESRPPTEPAPSSEKPEPTPSPLGSVAETPPPQGDPFAGIALQGIIRFDPASPEVLINGKTLKVGEFFKDVQVVEIGTDSVKLRYKNIEKVIRY